jgi:hypothetical protein
MSLNLSKIASLADRVSRGDRPPQNLAALWDLGRDALALIAEVERLTGKVYDLETELVGWQDRESEWQTATGLTRGGDPGGVEPRHLQEHIMALSRLEQAARVMRRVHEGCVMSPGCGSCNRCEFDAAVDALQPDDE